jgi:hypothetical protein
MSLEIIKDPIENRKVPLIKILIIYMKEESPYSYGKIPLEVDKVSKNVARNNERSHRK